MKVKEPQKLASYFRLERTTLFVVTITGILYNVGLTAGPYFEGRLVQRLYDIFLGTKTLRDMLVLAALYVAVIAAVQVIRALKRYYVRRFANNTSRNMRHMIYNSLVNASASDLHDQNLGTLMTKAIADVDACVEGMRKFTTEVFDTGVAMIAYFVLLLRLSPKITVMSCVFIPIAYVIADRCKYPVTRFSSLYKKSAGNLNETTMDRVGNAVLYRVFGREEERGTAYEQVLSGYEHAAVRANVWESALQPVYFVITMFGAGVIFYYGGRYCSAGAWDIGTFTTFFTCFTKLATKASKSAKLFNSVQKANVSWKRVGPMLHEYIPSRSCEAACLNTFAYDHADVFFAGCAPVAENLSFTLRPGEILGVTGAVASGKSAVFKALIDEADYSGHILVDGKEWKDLSPEERNAVLAYQGHEPQLLSTSVRENIQLGREIEIGKWLEMVRLDGEVDAMEEKAETRIGNGGVTLSGGQKDRLALARTLSYERPLIVLDDPFSAVDMKTEEEIFDELRDKMKSSALVLISHRLALFPKLDRILYLEDGRGYVGTHAELMEHAGYAVLYNLQIAKGGERHE